MSEDMNLSVNGQSQVPPGFRFHPTEEELLHYYLRKKVASKKIDLDVIRDVDLNKLEPWDIQDKCKIGSTPQNDWYFFSHKDKKYPTGTRTNRATAAGFWKATGRDKVIHSSFRRIGMRKTLVFYKGRAPHGLKSDWIMHEYRLDDTVHDATAHNPPGGETVGEEGWVVCRVFRKKNYHKALESPQSSSTSMDLIRSSQMRNSSNDGILDQILEYMGRSCKQENETISNNLSSADCDNNNMHLYDLPSINTSIDHEIHDRFTHLPRLEATNAPTMPSLTNSNNSPFNQDYSSTFIKACGQAMDDVLGETEPSCADEGGGGCKANTVVYGHGQGGDRLNDWVALDRLVASQLNGQDQNASKLHLSCYGDPNEDFCFSTDHENVQLSQLRPNRPDTIQPSRVYSSDSEIDWWSFTRSSSSLSSDPLCHLSV